MNCRFSQSYENTIQSFLELRIFTFVCVLLSYFIFTTTDEQTKRIGLQYVPNTSDSLEGVDFFACPAEIPLLLKIIKQHRFGCFL